MNTSSHRVSVYWKCECCKDRYSCDSFFFCCCPDERRVVVEEEEVCKMCWITLTPKDASSKRKPHHHHHPHIPHIPRPHPHIHLPHTPHHHHRRHSYHHHHDRVDDDASIEHLVRRDRVTESYEKLRLRIVTPSSSSPSSPPRHHHHIYHDRHPLHLNPIPIKLRGPGRKRTAFIPPPITIPIPERVPPKEDPIYRIQPFPESTPNPRPKPKEDDPIYRIQPFPDLTPNRPPPPPPERDAGDPIYRIQPFPDLGRPRRRRDSGTGDRDDPTYQIQPIYEVREPKVPIVIPDREIRDRTRAMLRKVGGEWERERDRGKTVRRVKGYDVLAKRVPWSWECVSSVGSSVR